MALKQKLKGEQNKTYNVLINFDKGIDRKTADDISDDTSFRTLTNFWNEKEGNLSKRPGLYEFSFVKMIQTIWDSYSAGNYHFCNKNVVSDVIPSSKFSTNLNLLTQIFCNLYEYRQPMFVDGTTVLISQAFKPTDLLLFQILKDDNFHTVMENYDFSEGVINELGKNGLPSNFELNATIIIGGNITGTDYTAMPGEEGVPLDFECDKGLFIWKIHMYGSTDMNNIIMDIDNVGCLDNNGLLYWEADKVPVLWKYNLDFKKPMHTASYNGYTYISTGTDYIIKIILLLLFHQIVIMRKKNKQK